MDKKQKSEGRGTSIKRAAWMPKTALGKMKLR